MLLRVASYRYSSYGEQYVGSYLLLELLGALNISKEAGRI
jgi:hypothetical protein